MKSKVKLLSFDNVFCIIIKAFIFCKQLKSECKMFTNHDHYVHSINTSIRI